MIDTINRLATAWYQWQSALIWQVSLLIAAVWLIRRPLQNLRELCCDATVADLLREHMPAYRNTLLTTARNMLAPPANPGLGWLGLVEDSHWLAVRLKHLERPTWRHRRMRRVCVVSVVLLVCCCVLPMAPLVAAPAERKVSSHANPYQVALPSGVTIELIGLRRLGGDTWWKPNGAALADAPYDTPVAGHDDRSNALFPGPGFQSLSAAQFLSDQAKTTPIAYVKPVLDTPELSGTNVLYGDGHIAWVSKSELESLTHSFSK